jgi:23S rRNA (cytosine1962-C5)-methyltransferase
MRVILYRCSITMLANRLEKRFRHLRKWARRFDVECFRVYERDIPEFPLIVDWYDGDVVAWFYDRTKDDTHEKRGAFEALATQEILQGLVIAPERLHSKFRRRQKGLDQYERFDESATVRIVREQGLQFEVNLSDYLDVGLFLDHRQTRQYIRERAQGKSLLNLFAYTGSFSCYAAAGGARRTLTVDMSRTYQEWTARNLRLNGCEVGAAHGLVHEDCLQFLAHSTGERFDLIVCDPPTFSNSKRMQVDSFSVDRDWPELFRLVEPWLAPEGELWFSTNSKRFELDPAQLPAGLHALEITVRTTSEDFKDKWSHRCWIVSRIPPRMPKVRQ